MFLIQQALSKKGKRIEDPQIVAWANSKVEGSKIRSFGDPSLSTGVFLLKVGWCGPVHLCVAWIVMCGWRVVRFGGPCCVCVCVKVTFAVFCRSRVASPLSY